jgi:Fic family protein
MDMCLPSGQDRVKMGKNGYPIMHEIKNITITPEILKLIADIDEFKGRWKAMQTLAPERLTSLKRVATIESIGSSTRIEGAKLTDRQVEKLLSGMKSKSFASRDEQEVAGYSDAMDMIFESFNPLHRRKITSSSYTVSSSNTAKRTRTTGAITRRCRTT